MYTNTIKVLVTSSRKHKYVWMHAWLSLGNFCIPQSTPFTWVPKPCGYAASVVLANCKGKHWKFRRRRICSAGPSEANKNNGCEHAESLARRDTAGLHDGLAVAQGVKSVTTTMAVGLTCYHWSGDRHRNGGSRVKRGLYLPAWIVLRMAIPGVLLLLQGIPSTIFMAR